MRHQLPFDGTLAAARLAALFAILALLVWVGSVRNRGSTGEPRSTEPSSQMARGTAGMDVPDQSTRR